MLCGIFDVMSGETSGLKRSDTYRLLWISCLLLFISRAILAIFENPAIAEFLSYQQVIGKVVMIFISWEEYVTTIYPILAEWISWVLFSIYCTAILALLKPSTFRVIIWIGGCFLLLEILLALPGDYYWYLNLAGKTLMWLPVFLFTSKYIISLSWLKTARLAIFLVFASHALLAMNFMPLPGLYVDMIMKVTNWTEDITHYVLFCAGVLDMVAATCILIWPRCPGYFWWYLIIWGLATAIARLVANWSIELDMRSNLIWFSEMLLRFPHGLVPLALFIRYKQVREKRHL